MSSCSGESKMHNSILLGDLSFDKSEMVAEGNYLSAASSPDDIFSLLEALESSEFDPLASVVVEPNGTNNINDHEEGDPVNSNYMEEPKTDQYMGETLAAAAAAAAATAGEGSNGKDSSRKTKRQKLMSTSGMVTEEEDVEGQQKVSHITVERNRRKQMNDNLIVLRSLMPSFYVKRGDQASVVGGVVDYINELQQVLQSLDAKKQRKVYSEVVVVSSPRLSTSSTPIIPRKPPLSPRLIANSSSLPISPTTPTPTSSYNNNKHHRLYQLSPAIILPAAAAAVSSSLLEPSCPSSSSSIDHNELVANSKSAIADVQVKLSGPNVVLKTISPVLPGQAVKIISALEEHLSLEIIDFSLNTIDHQTMLNSFTIKIGIECKLSADELAQQIQQTFS